jgi:hypothetical protein
MYPGNGLRPAAMEFRRSAAAAAVWYCKMNEASAAVSLGGLLERWSHGDRDALNALLTQLYRDVHAIAVRQLRDERHLTIQPTALVH